MSTALGDRELLRGSLRAWQHAACPSSGQPLEASPRGETEAMQGLLARMQQVERQLMHTEGLTAKVAELPREQAASVSLLVEQLDSLDRRTQIRLQQVEDRLEQATDAPPPPPQGQLSSKMQDRVEQLGAAAGKPSGMMPAVVASAASSSSSSSSSSSLEVVLP